MSPPGNGPATEQELRDALAFLTDTYVRFDEGRRDVAIWLWEAIQGDFNLDRSTGQVTFDAAISMIPVVDQICDVRDIIANCMHLNEDSSDKWSWIALCLTLIGLIPSLGSLLKGVLKIFFLFVRRFGGRQLATAIEEAMTWVITFLRKKEVEQYWKALKIDDIFGYLADETRKLKGRVDPGSLTRAFDTGIAKFRELTDKVKLVPVVGARAQAVLETVLKIRRQFDNYVGEAIAPIQEVLDQIIRRLDAEHLLYRGARVNTLNVHFRGTLPQTKAVTLMRQSDPPPRWLKEGEPPHPGLNPKDGDLMDDLRGDWLDLLEEKRLTNSDFPMLSDRQITTFHRVRPDVLEGPQKLYRVTSPSNGAAGDCWMLEEDFMRLMKQAEDPKSDWRQFLAVWPQWNPNGQFVVLDIPAGGRVNVWRGPAASQVLEQVPEMEGKYLEGGWEQIVIMTADQGNPTGTVSDTFRFFRQSDDMSGRLDPTELDYSAFKDLPEAEKARHVSLREAVNDPRIQGPYDTGWGTTDFDAQLEDVKLGLPNLPGQVTKQGDGS
ncbi:MULTISPECIES: hypothetical protein [Alloalcanivorax]|jgi:hypothetical protein|uniref:Uncharacterized protein n=1 Tax=Alcanivorax dieselolei (strain DSM 16502 / CGMCC 1.3690 / MCCC 1A00001 / B-5) TaxID=930169 RepID=K0C9Z9_ALCDB|nr:MULTISPECIES: hypothetical protein [Alloalcanivorax]ERS06955.1 hypothetical protein Q668_21610 [Alcanivorax sp. PN-3]AFT70374.1 hypothetical protein B5T_02100 [Alloalcanivorax dieselolei B5]ARB45718.1 hypothetical protein P40_10050 [Alloalcanivorax xenomutans]CUR48868.1 conserved domain protein [Alloalcanivorax xenomutans]GGJ83749.1 hypothetical protein GCM10007426_11060 [Alloalcanivorax dieselolei]